MSENLKSKYVGLDGTEYDSKPEFMTSLRGALIVQKDHKIIKLRGEIDLLLAEILKTQHVMRQQNSLQAVDDLTEIIIFLQAVMKCEVENSPLPDVKFMGLSEDELQKRSHHPEKYYGIEHFMPSLANGHGVLELNYLRARARQVEISACEAFTSKDGKHEREDIIRAMNRLSSVLYVIMFRVITAEP